MKNYIVDEPELSEIKLRIIWLAVGANLGYLREAVGVVTGGRLNKADCEELTREQMIVEVVADLIQEFIDDREYLKLIEDALRGGGDGE